MQLCQWWLKAINDSLNMSRCGPVHERQCHLACWASLEYQRFDSGPAPHTASDAPDESSGKRIAIGCEFSSGIVGTVLEFAVSQMEFMEIST